MNISKEAHAAHAILSSWQEDYHFYDLNILHDLEVYEEFEEMDYLEHWFGFDIAGKFEDKFIQFAADGTGGAYILWFYPDLKGEPPVVFFGSEGETAMLAPSMQDFVCLIASGQILGATHADNIEGVWRTEIEDWEYEDLMDEDEDLETLAQAKTQMSKDIEDFKNLVSGACAGKTSDVIFAACKGQPDFVHWVEDFMEKHKDLAEENYRAEHEKNYAYIDRGAETFEKASDRVKLNLPKHFSLPKEFLDFCDWCDENIDGYSRSAFTGSFRLYGGGEFLKPWDFYDDVIERFGILIDDNNGTIALWQDDAGKDWLVHMDYDIEECYILTDNFKDLFTLLAVGYADLGSLDSFEDTPLETAQKFWEDQFEMDDLENYTALPDFQQWVQETYRVSIPLTGEKLVYQGENHFKAWLRNLAENSQETEGS